VNDDAINAIVADLPPIYCRRCHGFYAATEGYCPTCGPPHGDAPPASNNGARPVIDSGPTSWEPADMNDALDGVDPPAAELFRRTDGVPMLYRGAIHWFQGESESCKSWAAQLAVAQVLNDGGRVLYIDFEDDVRSVVHRLLAMVVDRDAIAKRFEYIHPDEPLADGRGRITAGGVTFARMLAEHVDEPWDLVIVDGVTEAMTVEDLDLGSNTDIATWLRRLPKRLADLGAAVVMIDHVTKSREERGRYAIGGQHKLAGVTGAAYAFTGIRPFHRAGSDPVTGSVGISVVKDRPGFVRRHARDGKIGTLELTAYPDGGVSALVVPANAEPAPELDLAMRVLGHLSVYDGASMRNIEEGVPGGAAQLRSCLKWLAHEDRAWIVVEQKGRSHLHWLTDEGRGQLGELGD
jgi:hypothetical protein